MHRLRQSRPLDIVSGLRKPPLRVPPFSPAPLRVPSSHPSASTFRTNALAEWTLWTAVMGAAAVGSKLGETPAAQRLGLSSPVLIMGLSWALASLNIIPTSCHLYDLVWSKLVPIAASLLLLESDLSSITRMGKNTFIAFLLGATGTLIGTVAAWTVCGHLLNAVTSGGWKIASALCASYIGGSVNFAAVVTSTGLRDNAAIAAATTADNFVMAVFLTVLTVWRVPSEPRPAPSMQSAESVTRSSLVASTSASSTVEAKHVLQGLSAACASVALGAALASHLHAPLFSLALSSIVAAAIGSLAQRIAPGTNPFAGARDVLGNAIMALFFVTVGASAACTVGLATTSTLTMLLFISIQLMVHLLWTVVVGKYVLRLPTRDLLVASNANIGGPATAAAMCSARGWNDLLGPAILSGCLGYAVGTGLALSLPLRTM